jgi:beta-phosphoglucomutase
MKFKAIIFDMDGTIIDTGDAWKKATQKLVEYHGVQYTIELHNEINKYVVGAGLVEACRRIQEIAQIQETIENLMHRKKIIVADILHENLEFIQGFPDFHVNVKTLEMKSGLATNADDNTLAIAKKVLNLESLFGEHIYNVSHVEKPKPHPDLYLHAAKQLIEHPEECLAVEDSAIGISAARAAGMYVIGINTGGDINEVKNADLIINKYDEVNLAELIKKI